MPAPSVKDQFDPRGYPAEMHYQAQELYCVLRHTYSQVAEELQVPVSTLKRWGKKYDWRDKREELAKAQADIKADTILARSVFLKAAISQKTPQLAFAVSSLEKLAIEQAEIERSRMTAEQMPESIGDIEVDSFKDAVELLQTGLEQKMKMLLSRPEDIDLKAITELQKAFALLEDLTSKYNPEDKKDQNQGLSDEAAEDIRKKILGIG